MYYEALNESRWKGVISEFGIGMQFSAKFLLTPGSSSTILGVHCPYHDASRPDGVRAVSLENVERIAKANLDEAIAMNVTWTEESDYFGIAISGAHYEDRPSHVFMYIATTTWDAYIHFDIPTNPNREHVAHHVQQLCMLFVANCMVKQESSWTDWIQDLGPNHGIDILYAPGVSDFERLLLLSPTNPLVYHDFKFQRVTDYARKYKIVYPGAFNPPTERHLAVDDCLYEISQRHFYKGDVSFEDLLHRMRMLNTEGRPVMVSQCPRFIDKHAALEAAGSNGFMFVLGSDAWNRTIAAHQYPNEGWLGERMSKATFFIMPRPGDHIQENGVSRHLTFEIAPDDYYTEHSSSAVRESDDPAKHEFLTEPIANYVDRHEMYKEPRKISER